jgi:hypothetical protein
MDNKNYHILNLITSNIVLITQVNQHFEEIQTFSLAKAVPFVHVNRLYRLIVQHHAQTKNSSLFLLKTLG